MSKVRVYEVARDLGMDNKALVALFQSVGVTEVRNHMSAVAPEAVERVKRHLEKQSSEKVVEERIRPTVVKRRVKKAEARPAPAPAPERVREAPAPPPPPEKSVPVQAAPEPERAPEPVSAPAPEPEKSRRIVRHSQSTIASAYTSVRRSTFFPNACSGDM